MNLSMGPTLYWHARAGSTEKVKICTSRRQRTSEDQGEIDDEIAVTAIATKMAQNVTVAAFGQIHAAWSVPVLERHGEA